MPTPDSLTWIDRLAGTLRRYDEELLRKVAARLVKPRNQWPADELIRRCQDVIGNPAVLDRRLAEIAPAGRHVLAMIGSSQQFTWALGNVVELLMAVGQEDGLAAVFDLLEAGLLFPLVEPVPEGEERRSGRLVSFAHWLGTAGTGGLMVFTLPEIARRARAGGLPFDSPEGAALVAEIDASLRTLPSAVALESDGLEWLLRLGALWQMAATPFRRTQQGGFFKRDVERLESDPLLNTPPTDRLVDVPDLAFLLVVLAELQGVIQEVDGEIHAGTLPTSWEEGLAPALASLCTDLFRLHGWTPLDGWRDVEAALGNPFPSAFLLTFLLLGRMSEEAWVAPQTLETWIVAHHPYWATDSLRPSRRKPWMETFLLGVCHPLRLVQAARGEDGAYLVRLSATGRWFLGRAEEPPAPVVFPRTLLVQPNLEMIAYRQGLTPALIARLTRFAAWKTLGAACTLQLQPETVYRALENGETFDSISRTLEQHGTRALPAAVLDSLRTWANKRNRITVFPSASLMEFNSAQELDEALARGLTGLRVSDTVLVVPSEDQIEFRHFRLTGTRDYGLPPERCVAVEPDGVTLSVDLARSDLMLETELPRFAELVERATSNGKRQYRLTAPSLAAARNAGMSLASLETWFQQRTGQSVTPAAQLLLTGANMAAPQLRQHLVLHVDTAEIADGIMQWPQTRGLIAERLGPTALSVTEEHVAALKNKLAELGVQLSTG